MREGGRRRRCLGRVGVSRWALWAERCEGEGHRGAFWGGDGMGWW